VRAFVTGATGFIGRHLTEALVARGIRVTALVRSAVKGRELAHLGVQVVEGDLARRPPSAGALAGHDVLFHVAGLVAARDEAEFLAVNRDGTRRLTALAREAGIGRFVLVSSLAAGGPSSAETPLRGNEPPRPVTRYGRSKLAAEVAVRESGLPWTIVRPPATYGPGDREMHRLFRAASLGVAPVLGRGSLRLSLVFGPDLARALVAAAEADRTLGGVYYAAHPEIVTSRHLLERLGNAVGRRVRVVSVPEAAARVLLYLTGAAARLAGRATVLNPDKANEFFQPAWTCDPAPLVEATGWRAEVDLERGAHLTVAWYREKRWL
jgi:nucleoside-diphosphate-sugar epimerase